ncbi:hypothetical protein O9A_00389 [Bartonella koehlerae C-29]|uniref:Uncharacterized protein n=1 Tax=Bartonella koehlerae C-29 TaxID=1134510 RepID=A0A067W8N9_9HYPH|nr:hypothetical protein O9A_00389 [Bartonella koehlerae C-29]
MRVKAKNLLCHFFEGVHVIKNGITSSSPQTNMIESHGKEHNISKRYMNPYIKKESDVRF